VAVDWSTAQSRAVPSCNDLRQCFLSPQDSYDEGSLVVMLWNGQSEPKYRAVEKRKFLRVGT
jgi:hypothetical protein